MAQILKDSSLNNIALFITRQAGADKIGQKRFKIICDLSHELLQILDLCTDKHPVDLRWAPSTPNPASLPTSGDPATIPPTLMTVPPPIYLPDKIATTSVTLTETIPKTVDDSPPAPVTDEATPMDY